VTHNPIIIIIIIIIVIIMVDSKDEDKTTLRPRKAFAHFLSKSPR